MVQFLNVFYAKGTRNVRRLHQLCESVVIFDEVQKVPVHCVSLFNEALNFLKTFGRSSIILCTATQPALDYVEHKLAINTDAEMVRDLGQVAEAFKRVEIVDLTLEEPYTTEKLCAFIAAKLQEVRSILVILNTKTVVRRLYERLKQAGLGVPVIHLSTSMCAEHRQDRLRTIRQRLERNEPVVCVSTQLIEAGVDVSFPCVIRSLAGLDSIAQAAGRCNRHGEWGIQHVYVVDHAEENLERLPEIRAGKQAAKRILIDLRREPSAHGGNILSAQAMERYFQELYARFRTDLDYHVRSLNRSMVELLAPPRRLIGDAYRSRHGEPLPLYLTNSCHTAAEHFQVITDRTTSVLVPYGRGLQLIAAFNGAGTIGDLGRKLREAQRYVVNLYDHEKRRLEESGGLVPLLDGRVLAVREGAYHAEYGLDTEQEGPLGFLDF
jgi:CRISPR-associated endonuclease/helicase Cas3